MIGLNICLISLKTGVAFSETNLNLLALITFSFISTRIFCQALFICKVLIELSQLLLRTFGRSFLVKAFDFFSFLQRSLKKYSHERYDNSKEKHPNTDMVQHQGCLPPLIPPRFQDHVLLDIISQDPIGAFLVPWHVTTVLTVF